MDGGAFDSNDDEDGGEHPKTESNRALGVVMRIVGAKTSDVQRAVKEEWAKYSLCAAPGQEVLAYLTERSLVTKDGKVVGTKVASLTERLGYWEQHGCHMYPHLAKAALRLLSVTITTAAAERNWSQWGMVAVPRRNRLQASRAEKLVYVRGNLMAGSNTGDTELTMDVLEDNS